VSKKRKEQLIISALFILAIGLGLLVSGLQQRPVSEYPDQLSPLNAEDFVLVNTNPHLQLGVASMEEVRQQYPDGKMLGRSGVYKLTHLNAIFTFTRKTNILTKLDITGPGLVTARSVSVNNSFTKVVKNYGDGFIRSYYKNDPQTFDAVYGEGQCIVFHVKDNIVKKIVILHEIEKTI
jgi:hypothetical protein